MHAMCRKRRVEDTKGNKWRWGQVVMFSHCVDVIKFKGKVNRYDSLSFI